MKLFDKTSSPSQCDQETECATDFRRLTQLLGNNVSVQHQLAVIIEKCGQNPVYMALASSNLSGLAQLAPCVEAGLNFIMKNEGNIFDSEELLLVENILKPASIQARL